MTTLGHPLAARVADLERRLVESGAARDQAIADAATIEAAFYEQRAAFADRLDRARNSLDAIAAACAGNRERLIGKAQGVSLAASYLDEWVRMSPDSSDAA